MKSIKNTTFYNKISWFLQWINISKPIYIGISWWPDSVFLAIILKQFYTNITLLHFNHWTWTSKDAISIIKKTFPTIPLIIWETSKKLLTETAFRKERLHFFDEHCSDWALFLWHNLSDRIETSIININRWCWIFWFLSIQLISKRKNYNIYRPLLAITKKSIIEYLELLWITYYKDISNNDSWLTIRNKIRNQTIPNYLDKKNISYNDYHQLRQNNYNTLYKIIDTRTKKIQLTTYLSYPTREAPFFYSCTIETELDVSILLKTLNISVISSFLCKKIYTLFTTKKQWSVYNKWVTYMKCFWKNYILFWHNKFWEGKKNRKISVSKQFFDLKKEENITFFEEWLLYNSKNWSKKVSKKMINKKIPVFMRNIVPVFVSDRGEITWIFEKSKCSKKYR